MPRGDAGRWRAAIDERTAAVILEPVQGLAGALRARPRLLAAARAATARAGALLVFDEVQCGSAGSARLRGAAATASPPTSLTVGKGLAGGLPAAAVLVASAERCRRSRPATSARPSAADRLVMAAVEATLARALEEGLALRARILGRELARLAGVGPGRPHAGRGAADGSRLQPPRPADPGRAAGARTSWSALAADPAVVRLLPPLVIEREHIDQLRATLAELAP